MIFWQHERSKQKVLRADRYSLHVMTNVNTFTMGYCLASFYMTFVLKIFLCRLLLAFKTHAQEN